VTCDTLLPSALLLERLMISSDEFYVHVCEKCGLLAWEGMCQVAVVVVAVVVVVVMIIIRIIITMTTIIITTITFFAVLQERGSRADAQNAVSDV